MKKLISILCAAAMLVSMSVLPAAAEEEFETETTTSLEGFYAGNNTTMEIVNDTVDGIERPVIKWNFLKTTCDFGTTLMPAFTAGTYRLTVKYYCPQNPGQGRFGMRSISTGGYPDNSPIGAITKNDAYTTVTRDVIVQNGNTSEQYIRMRFGSGDEGACYIAEFKAQKVLDDGSLGDNILPEFYSTKIKGTTEGWEITKASDTMEIDYATVDGVYKPVAKWSYSTSNSNFQYSFGGSLPKGDYRITLTYYSPNNPGVGKIGLRNDSNGGFPSNTTEKTVVKNKEYQTVTRDVTVTNDTVEQYLKILCEYGDTGILYISEVKLQPIDSDGNLGENLIANGDFMQRKLPEPDRFEASGLMFDVVDDNGDSMTGEKGIEFIPNTDVYRMSASVNVKNNGSEPINPILIVAMYYEGSLYEVDSVQLTINSGENEDLITYLSVPETVGDGKLTAKAFVWEDANNMTPVTPRLYIEE